MSTVDRLQPGHNGSATDRLTEVMQKFVLEPAIPFSASLVLDTMIEQKNGIPLIHQAPWHPFQVPYSGPVFFGATFDGNPNETEHIHPAQWELYFTVKGRLRVKVWFGAKFEEYSVGPGDVLLLPAGRWHFAEFAEKPGMAWVVKAPNDLQGDAAKVVRKKS